MTKTLFLIDTYRLQNCHALMLAFNLWNETLHRSTPLKDGKILDLVKQIKASTISILDTCQSRPGYVPWMTVKRGQKRRIAEVEKGGQMCHKRIRYRN